MRSNAMRQDERPERSLTRLNTHSFVCGSSGDRGGGAKKIVGRGVKGSEGETRIRIEGGVLLGGESLQKL